MLPSLEDLINDNDLELDLEGAGGAPSIGCAAAAAAAGALGKSGLMMRHTDSVTDLLMCVPAA